MRLMILAFSLFLVGCGLNPQITMLSEIAFTGEKFSSVYIVPKNVSLMPKENNTFFKNTLQAEFEKEGYALGDELEIQYSIISYMEGNAFMRWLSGSLARADGKLEAEIIFVGKQKKELEKIRYTYELKGTETMKDVLEDLAQKVCIYALQHFLAPKPQNAS